MAPARAVLVAALRTSAEASVKKMRMVRRMGKKVVRGLRRAVLWC